MLNPLRDPDSYGDDELGAMTADQLDELASAADAQAWALIREHRTFDGVLADDVRSRVETLWETSDHLTVLERETRGQTGGSSDAGSTRVFRRRGGAQSLGGRGSPGTDQISK
jgi:hypothetical protein